MTSKNTSKPDDGLTLCLSGGGYRAAIFHLGALRVLNETGILHKITKISSVSGGSIVSGFLAYTFQSGWPTQKLSEEEFQTRIVNPLFKIINTDIRTKPVLLSLLPWNWFDPSYRVEKLRENYVNSVFNGNDMELADIPEPPEFVLCATDMVFGVNWESCKEHVGNYEAGYVEPVPCKWTVARAIAASSCFPPIFNPAKTYIDPTKFKKGKYKNADRDQLIDGIRLTDGGVYDNLGLQPAFKDKNVLVSDSGGALEFVHMNCSWRQLPRYPALLQNGIGKLRKRWLMRDFSKEIKKGTLWSINDNSNRLLEKYQNNHAVIEMIKDVRTDLNRFTFNEFKILQDFGYLSAANRVLKYAEYLLDDNDNNSQKPDFNTLEPPYKTNHDLRMIERALKHSKSRLCPYWLR